MLAGLYAKLIGAGLVLAALAGAALYLHHAGAVSQKAVDDRTISVLRDTVTSYKSANQTNIESIATLELRNRQCTEKNAANEALAQTYFNAERDYAARLQVAKTKTERAIQVIYEHDPSARQWARTAVPAALAERLRANAGADHPHADH